MLPKTPEESGMATHSIYINPNFKKFKATTTKTHINPNFLLPRTSTAIHLNPNFLQGKLIEHQRLAQEIQSLNRGQHSEAAVISTPLAIIPDPNLPSQAIPFNPNIPGPSCKLISKSSMRIVREPMKQSKPIIPSSTTNNQMIKLGRCKLLRSTLLGSVPRISTEAKSQMKRVHVGAAGKYKIDRRSYPAVPSVSPLQRIRRRAFVARFALRRTSDFTTKRKLSASSDSKKAAFILPSVPSNKNLQLLNINGVLYKSTRNKLQRKESTTSKDASSSTNPKVNLLTPIAGSRSTLIVRGTRFLMDKQGFKLTRVSDEKYAKPSIAARRNSFRRIDIGGLTYVATSQNTFVRTGNHLARSHVNNAKQKSVQLLTRNLAKSNIPCAIFQRVGKCAAFDRGKCRKVHDRRQVSICSRFLRGSCSNSNCLLSHNVSLKKMPVCKFYLQGVCVRADCPYLHKKVGKNTEICNEFLRGYCKLAEQCDKRHEFLCPDYERHGICEKSSCVYCKRKRQGHREPKHPISESTSISSIEPETVPSPKRYFIDESRNEMGPKSTEEIVNDFSVGSDDDELSPATSKPSRPKLGILPAYIPLS